MKFYFATKNQHKIKEFERILTPLGIELVCESDLDSPLPDVEETGTTFEENAMLKAEFACEQTGLPSLADDSGLCVDCLHGEPGIMSARYAGEHGNDQANNDKLLKKLEGIKKEQRTARFVCAVACVFPDGRHFVVKGVCEGYIGFEEQGDSKFGYDPLFVTDIGCFGALSADRKDSVSHRGRALRLLKAELEKIMNGEQNVNK